MKLIKNRPEHMGHSIDGMIAYGSWLTALRLYESLWTFSRLNCLMGLQSFDLHYGPAVV